VLCSNWKKIAHEQILSCSQPEKSTIFYIGIYAILFYCLFLYICYIDVSLNIRGMFCCSFFICYGLLNQLKNDIYIVVFTCYYISFLHLFGLHGGYYPCFLPILMRVCVKIYTKVRVWVAGKISGYGCGFG
jgi:hypothetical protein